MDDDLDLGIVRISYANFLSAVNERISVRISSSPAVLFPGPPRAGTTKMFG